MRCPTFVIHIIGINVKTLIKENVISSQKKPLFLTDN